MAPRVALAETACSVHEAGEPPEERGLLRDQVRLLVSHLGRDTIEHARFADIGRWLAQGDLLVVNTSGTLNAALEAFDGREQLELHLSTALPGGFWTVEVRKPTAQGTRPYRQRLAGRTLSLPSAGVATLLAPYPLSGGIDAVSRLWIAAIDVPLPLTQYLELHGFPIRYGYVKDAWPPAMYQTVFVEEYGSAEMPSAGRPFTSDLVTRLVSAGVQVAPLLLHTGVASLEDHEAPYEEFYRVSRDTADRVNAAKAAGGRVIAVGTTVARALESVTDERGRASAGSGWTNLVIGPDRPLRIVNGLVTGLHEPRATHWMILEQVAVTAAGGRRGVEALRRAYGEAVGSGYLWHEFGDSHLIIGGR